MVRAVRDRGLLRRWAAEVHPTSPTEGRRRRQGVETYGERVTTRSGDPAKSIPSRIPTGETSWVVLLSLVLATTLANVASVCLFPHIVALSTEFGRPVNQVVWAIVGFHLIATGVGGVAAALGAVFGHRRMLITVLVLLFGGSLVVALSTNLAVLIVGRVIQGVGMATQALAVGIIANYWKGESMRRALSMIVFAMALGAVIAYLGSGFIWRAGGDWRTLFWILAGAAAADLVLTSIFVRETRSRERVPIDYVGCVGLVLWSVLLLLPLSQANSWGWGSAKVLGLLLPGIAAVLLWIWWELRTRAPLIDLRVLKRAGVWQGAVVWPVITGSMCIPAAAYPYLLQTPVSSGFGFGRSLFIVSLALAVPAIMMTLLSGTATPIMRLVGPKRTMLLGLTMGLAGFGMAFAHGSIWLNLLWLALTGSLGAWAGSASYAVAAEAVRPEQGIMVSAIYNTAGATGAAVAGAVAGFVLTLRTVAVDIETPSGLVTEFFPAEETFTWSALIVGGAAVVGILCVLTIRSRQLHSPGQRDAAPSRAS